MTAPLAYIHDGYTQQGYIAEDPRLYPAVRFSYRPFLPSDRSVVYDQLGKADPRKGESISAAAVASKVIDWDIKNHKGESVPVTTESALRLQPSLAKKLFLIVTGAIASDEDPDDLAGNAEAADQELAAALEGNSLEDHQAKN